MLIRIVDTGISNSACREVCRHEALVGIVPERPYAATLGLHAGRAAREQRRLLLREGDGQRRGLAVVGGGRVGDGQLGLTLHERHDSGGLGQVNAVDDELEGRCGIWNHCRSLACVGVDEGAVPRVGRSGADASGRYCPRRGIDVEPRENALASRCN